MAAIITQRLLSHHLQSTELEQRLDVNALSTLGPVVTPYPAGVQSLYLRSCASVAFEICSEIQPGLDQKLTPGHNIQVSLRFSLLCKNLQR